VELLERLGVALPRRPGVLRQVTKLRGWWGNTTLLAWLALPACGESAAPGFDYVCGASSEAASAESSVCGAGDTNLPPEPTLPTDVCQTLTANKATPDESNLDTDRIQAALTACKGRAVKLVSSGRNNAFVTGHLLLDSAILWIDGGTTLYASRNPDLYQKDGHCGWIGISDSGGCVGVITVSGTNPGIVGDGVIDGQGGEPLVGHDYSWWQMSGALRTIDGSAPNPPLIDVNDTTGFLMYRITLHNSPKFHVKLSSTPTPTGGSCTTPGKGFIVWGVTLLTPSRWMNSQGLVMSPYFSRNTDGIDPGANNSATCGVIACSTISTGDDQVAIKGGHGVSDLIIAHNHFGTGHGMSIGSETYGRDGVHDVTVYDLTIDADSRWTGSPGSDSADSNGIRVKSDESRGGVVKDITFRDVCIRDVANAILVSTAYNPLFAGTSYPRFGSLTFQNVHGVTCLGQLQPVVTLNGFNSSLPAGPITLDNTIIDNTGPQAVASRFADIRLGPGNVNFMPSGPGVTVTDNITEHGAPRACKFPKLPAPEPPPGWAW
jgi:polygalacturonase